MGGKRPRMPTELLAHREVRQPRITTVLIPNLKTKDDIH